MVVTACACVTMKQFFTPLYAQDCSKYDRIARQAGQDPLFQDFRINIYK